MLRSVPWKTGFGFIHTWLWVRDGALVKTGKATLVFSVTYEGQGWESVKIAGAPQLAPPKPIDLKIPVNVLR